MKDRKVEDQKSEEKKAKNLENQNSESENEEDLPSTENFSSSQSVLYNFVNFNILLFLFLTFTNLVKIYPIKIKNQTIPLDILNTTDIKLRTIIFFSVRTLIHLIFSKEKLGEGLFDLISSMMNEASVLYLLIIAKQKLFK